jgi:hypothetical protein
MDIANMSVDVIPQLSTALSTAKLQNEVGAALLSKAMDVFEEGAAAQLDMMRRSMELSVNPGIGANIDISV